jgi:CRP-like cAMP-binding protein
MALGIESTSRPFGSIITMIMTCEAEQEISVMKKRIEEIITAAGDEITIFDMMDSGEVRKIAEFFELLRYPAGTIVLKEGEIISYIGIIASGELKLERQGKFVGKWITLAILSKGAHFGDFSMLIGRESLGQLRAVLDTELLIITHSKLDAFMQENPYTGIKILKGISSVLSVRLKHAIDQIVLLS